MIAMFDDIDSAMSAVYDAFDREISDFVIYRETERGVFVETWNGVGKKHGFVLRTSDGRLHAPSIQ